MLCCTIYTHEASLQYAFVDAASEQWNERMTWKEKFKNYELTNRVQGTLSISYKSMASLQYELSCELSTEISG